MQTSVNYITYPGDMRFEDLNNTGTIDNGANTVDSPGDRKIIGNSEPRYIYTLSFSADWNNFFLSAMFDGVGNKTGILVARVLSGDSTTVLTTKSRCGT